MYVCVYIYIYIHTYLYIHMPSGSAAARGEFRGLLGANSRLLWQHNKL